MITLCVFASLREKFFVPSVRHLSGVFIVTVALLLGCRGEEPAPRGLVAEAEQLCLDQRYAEAIPLLRARLMEARDDTGAHYWLGLCYLSGDEFAANIARGEFETALHYFYEQGKKSPRERFSDEYFELRCLADIAKTYLLRIPLVLSNAELPGPNRLQKIELALAESESIYTRMQAINPESDLTIWLYKQISNWKQRFPVPRNSDNLT